MSKKLNNWKVMAVIILILGLFLLFIAPGLFDETMNTLILKQTKDATKLSAGPLSRMYIGSIYSGIEIMAGLALVGISYAVFTEKKWAWSAALFLTSIPAMANGYIGLGWLENLKKFPPSYITFFLSLLVFWVLILLKKTDAKEKGSMLAVFTLLGMLGAQGFMLFPHAVRVILKSPADALLKPANGILLRTGPLMLFVFVFAGLAIWKLAKKEQVGWYLALLTGLMMAFGAFPAHYARPLVASLVPSDTLAPSVFTSTYWMAGLQGVILVVLLLIPAIKSRLLDD